MVATGLVRTQYWNLSGRNPIPRTDVTDRAESRTDVEGHLMALDAAWNAALHGWGVAAGLQVSAVAGTAGVTVAPGVALDVDGHVVVLGEVPSDSRLPVSGAVAIVDPSVGPTGVQNIPTVPVSATGVVLDTTGLVGDRLLTITWREVEEVSRGLLVLQHAPWLRLVDPTTFDEDGLQLELGAVTLGAGGVVNALKPGSRRLIGVTAGRLELSLPGPATGLIAGQTAAATLAPRADGGMELTVISPAGAHRALSVAGGTGDVQLDAGLRVAAATTIAAGLTVSGRTEVTGDVAATGKLTLGGDLAVAGEAGMDADLQVKGNLGVTGDLRAASTALAALTVSGNVVVQGTAKVSGDVQLASNLTIGSGVTAGQATLGQLRVDGIATIGAINAGIDTPDQLGVRGNATIGMGGNGALNVRHVNGKHWQRDEADGLFLNWGNEQTVHVGGGKPANLTVSGNVVVQGTSDDGGAFDVLRRMRVRNQGGQSAGIWFRQEPRERAFVGMADDTHVGFWGADGVGWGLTMNTANGRVGLKTMNPAFDLDVNGTICAKTFCNPSDARLKTGVIDVVDVLDRLADVRAVTFVPIGAEPGPERRHAGVLAQDVVRAFPELVVPMGPDGLMAVDYSGLAGVLVGAVNELRAANAALASRVADLDRQENDDEHRS